MDYTQELQPVPARLLMKYVIPLASLALGTLFAYLLPVIGNSFSDTQMLKNSGLDALVYLRYVFLVILVSVVVFAVYFALRLFTEKVGFSGGCIVKRHLFGSRRMKISEIAKAEIVENTNIYAVDANRTAGSVAGHLLGCAHRIVFTDSSGQELAIEPVNEKMAAGFLQQIENIKTKLK